MVPHIMKTTVEIADDLLRRAKALATARNTTLRAVIEQGLRQVLRKDGTPTDFTLQDASVGSRMNFGTWIGPQCARPLMRIVADDCH